MLLPIEQWHRIFDPLNATRADLVRTQFHVRLDHRLPADPSAAYASVLGRANNLEVKLAGTGLVGDNLAATLGAARGDALYAEVLFLFLGLPGAVLAGLLTATVANAGADRRRREQALLRTRGATTRQLVQIALSEAAFVGVLGSIAGLGLAAAVGAAAFHHASFGATTGSAIGWGAGSALAGFVIAAASIAWPAGRDARAITVATARRTVGRATSPRWVRFGLDGWLLAAGLLVFWLTGRGGYQLVLAPEGVPSISVSYWAFAGPALLWIGAGLFAWRISDLFLRRGRKALAVAVRPVSGSLASTVAATMSRQRRLLARGVALLALTAAFAASTAVFNATYRQQANVDALLTNGADVTVTLPPAAPVNADYERRLAAVPGVRHVEAMQHRFAYVGADLQDLFGINPATIAKATKLQDAFFKGGTVKQLMTKLAQRPDNVLVSAETVKDFQLVPGDTIRLRLRNDRTNQLVTVPFHYAGIGTEFPTAPKDSFLIANRDYIAAKTGSGAVGAFLLDTGGASPAKVAARVRTIVGTTATVTDITATRQLVGSSLTAVDLAGLTRVELGFALALAAAASGARAVARVRRTASHVRDRGGARSQASPTRRLRLERSRIRRNRRRPSRSTRRMGAQRNARQSAHRRVRSAAREPRGAVGVPRHRGRRHHRRRCRRRGHRDQKRQPTRHRIPARPLMAEMRVPVVVSASPLSSRSPSRSSPPGAVAPTPIRSVETPLRHRTRTSTSSSSWRRTGRGRASAAPASRRCRT